MTSSPPEALLPVTPSRRLSRLTSGGREDWAYSSTLAAVDSPASSSASFSISLISSSQQAPQAGWLGARASWRARRLAPEPCLLLVDLAKRQLVVSPSGLGFPTRTISRMCRIETSSLEIRTSFGLSLKMDFALVEKRDELFKLVQQLNCLGGMVSQLFHKLRLSDLFTCQVLGRLPCLQLDGEDGSPLAPPSNFDEQEFVQWFLTVVASSDKVEPARLQREIELAVLPEQEPVPDLAGVSPKRGKLVSNLVLIEGEVLVSTEDFVTMLPLDGGVFGVPVLGEMFLTSLQIFFSTYFAYPESEDGTLPSLRFGRRPQKVVTTRQIPIKSIAKLSVVTGAQPTLLVETYLGEVHRFLFDRDSGFPQKYADQVREQQQQLPPLSKTLGAGLAVAPVYHIQQEFARQGNSSAVLMDNKVCDTYPNQLLLPAGFSPASLVAASKFRSRARVPAVTWHTGTGITLSRSSQPMSGVLQRGNRFDEELVGKLQVRYIVDCRGPLAVLGNTLAKGKGAESLARYPNTSLLFLGIGNIHTMRQAAVKSPPNPTWLLHQTSLWQGATRVAEMLTIEHASVLVHCSDGWDRTSQVVALAQVLVDPFYRTIRGLCVLVDKDFCHFGFQFHKRCVGRVSQERSPIWIQFIQCVWQAVRQLPGEFEYNLELLQYLARDPFAGRFPTLGFDSIRLRQAATAATLDNGQALWRFVLSHDGFVNPSFRASKRVIWIDPNRLAQWDTYL